MEIGEKIKFLRMRQGMTLEELGSRVGVGKSTVRKWETGQIANMRRDKIASLADALNVSPSYLIGWEDENNVYMDMKNNSGIASDNIGNIDKLLYCKKGGMKIGERIKSRRIELNITQDELARRLGYSDKSSISRIENSSKLTLNKVQLLADALNVSPSCLMGWEDKNNVDMDMRNNSGTISNSIGFDSSKSNNTYTTTNNYYSAPCSQNETTVTKDIKATITSKELFYEMLMVLKDMDDEQLNDMIRYGEFIKAR